MVTLSADLAARAGVHADPNAPQIKLQTANGIRPATVVMLKNISLGSIYMSDVPAVVLAPGSGPDPNLLGSNFLNRLTSVEKRDGLLILRQ